MFFNTRFLDLCDAELQSEDGETFRVHRIILATKTEYFSSMFCGMNANRSQFRIPGVNGRYLLQILKYIYTGEISEAELSLDLMLAADYLCLRDLHSQIKEYLKENMVLTIPDCLPLLKTFYYNHDEDISPKILAFVERNFKDIPLERNNSFGELPLEVLVKLLGSRNLNVDSETTVWLSIVKWTSQDVSTRSQYVPRLLMCLARKELDETLASDILQHEIVFEKNFMTDSLDFTSHLDAVLQLLEKYSSPSQLQPLRYRLPSQLQVIAYGCNNVDIDYRVGEVGTYNLYITYDETTDLWRRIGESVNCHAKSLTVVGHYIYIFGLYACRKFDILTQEWTAMANFRTQCFECPEDLSVLEVDGCLYRIGTCNREKCVVVEVYDVLNDSWSDCGTLRDVLSAKAVTSKKKIYLVGSASDGSGLCAKAFDTVSKLWEPFPKPNVSRHNFALVMYRDKVHLLEGIAEFGLGPGINEVFDPQTSNRWEEFPLLPCALVPAQAIVFNDQMIVYTSEIGEAKRKPGERAYRWNEVEGQWKAFERSGGAIDFRRLRLSTVEDASAIRSVTKSNRQPGAIWRNVFWGKIN